MQRIVVLSVLSCAACVFAGTPPTTGPSKVSFDPDGIITINGERFFPLGIWVYQLNPNVLADLHEHHFNTVVGNGFGAEQFDLLHEHGLMGVPVLREGWAQKLKDHPSLLAWYLHDEPESSKNAADMVAGYRQLKAQDPAHPIGLDHYLWEALTTFKDACDFTMTDVYPIMANRDGTVENVGKFIDESRRIHGANWPHWSFIQIFGGPETDGGKWAQPLPHEVRCMTFDALAHRANGILYFSYWPQAPVTWGSVAELNRELESSVLPWVLSKEGKEAATKSSEAAVHVRARRVGDSWMIIAVNLDRKPRDVTITPEGLGEAELRVPRDRRMVKSAGGKIVDHFDSFEARVYLAGTEPK